MYKPAKFRVWRVGSDAFHEIVDIDRSPVKTSYEKGHSTLGYLAFCA